MITPLSNLLNIYAAVPVPGGSDINLPPSPATGFLGQFFVTQLITKFLPIILVIAGFITAIIIVISGIQFITSGGNPEAAAGAKSRLQYALIGLTVIILAFVALQIVNYLFLGNTGIV